MMPFKIALCLLPALLTITPPALAESEGFYAGLNAGVGMPSLHTPNGTDKNSQAVVGAVAGYKFNPYLAVEAQYTGAGKVTDQASGSVKVDALSLSGIGYLPLHDRFSLYGKLGVASTRSKVSGGLNGYSDATRTGATYGIGAEYRFDQAIAMRVGWDHYKADVDLSSGGSQKLDSQVTGIGFIYSF